MLEQGVSRIGQPVQEIRDAMNQSGSNELAKLEKNLSVLNITGRIAPMFGFIGTIFGVIKIFYDINVAGDISIKSISEGLYEKMITSGAGLIVGVLAYTFLHLLQGKIDGFLLKMQRQVLEFKNLLL